LFFRYKIGGVTCAGQVGEHLILARASRGGSLIELQPNDTPAAPPPEHAVFVQSGNVRVHLPVTQGFFLRHMYYYWTVAMCKYILITQDPIVNRLLALFATYCTSAAPVCAHETASTHHQPSRQDTQALAADVAAIAKLSSAGEDTLPLSVF
jgi:hypothetical protein